MKSLIRYIIVLSCLSILISCGKKDKGNIISDEEKLTEFSLKHFSKNYSFTLTGESAEIISNKSTRISAPSFSLRTASEIIEIKTDKEGKGEIKVDPEANKLKEVVITGKILILYKDKKDGKITMEVSCGRVTYVDEKKEMVFEEKPIIKRGKNIFSGEKIIYNIENNLIEIKGNVNVEIYPEEKSDK